MRIFVLFVTAIQKRYNGNSAMLKNEFIIVVVLRQRVNQSVETEKGASEHNNKIGLHL
jgi:hypothetical protein